MVHSRQLSNNLGSSVPVKYKAATDVTTRLLPLSANDEEEKASLDRMLGLTTKCRTRATMTINQLGILIKKCAEPSLSDVSHLRFLSAAATSKKISSQKLAKLPVPPLDKTLSKYLRSVKPLVTDDEFKMTEDIVKKFSAPGGLGVKLQKLLEMRADQSENWLSDWWLQTAYLDFRWPVVVHSSPGLVFPLQDYSSPHEQIKCAAKMIRGAVDYKLMLDEQRLPEEKMGGEPVDMSQYFKIMGTCRIPGVTRDSVAFYSALPVPPKHIAVARNNHFFKVMVFGDEGEPLSEDQIAVQLHEILEHSSPPGIPVGILTSENRNTWGKAYKSLLKERSNFSSLEAIQSSLFLVCLDKPNPDQGSLNKQTLAAKQMVHGCGSQYNSGNRWFDKTIQFVIGTKGEIGLTYEHSPSEGPPVAYLMDHIMRYMDGGQKSNQPSAANYSPPQRLKFNVSDAVKEAIDVASRNLDVLADDLEMSCFTFQDYGSNFVKTQRLSPDSFIQMAIQLAFYRLHEEPGAHYESASLRKFNQGRTETIRSCSVESVAFAKAMLDSSKNSKEKEELLRSAVESHKEYTKGAVNGQGVDRHLLGLKLTAVENGLDVPKLFLDPSYSRSTYFKISTSQVASAFDKAFMCYGPLVPDGYGCCYNPRPQEMSFGISAFNSHPETSSGKFRDALEQSLRDMHDLLAKTQKSKL